MFRVNDRGVDGARVADGPALLSVVLLGALSCEAGGGPFAGTVSRSQFFEYHDRVDEPLCPTLLSLLDDHARLIAGKIGFNPDPADPIQYFKFRDDGDFRASSPCPPENGSCASASGVYSEYFFEPHELAHTYLFRAWGSKPTGLVAEGEAVALSCEPSSLAFPGARPRDHLKNPAWRDLLALYGNSTEGYEAAGYWITYLAGRYGWQSVRELNERARPGISATDFEREFARVYPISMDDAWSATLDTPGAAPCENDWRCMSTPLEVGTRVAPECDGQLHRSISVVDQAGVALTLGGVGTEILLHDCANPAAATYELTGGGTERTTHLAALPPGTYTMFPAPAPKDVQFSAYLPSTYDSGSCAPGVGVTIDPTEETHVDLLPGAPNGWIQIDGGGQDYLAETVNLTWTGWPAPAGAPAVCDGCDASANCVLLPAGQLTSVTIGDGSFLRLQGVSAVTTISGYGQLIIHPGTQASPGP